MEGTRVPMIPRWATTSQQKALSQACRKSPTIPAKAEGEVCDRAHNNPRVIEKRRRGDWAQGKLMPATAGAMHPSRRRKEELRKGMASTESATQNLLNKGRICQIWKGLGMAAANWAEDPRPVGEFT
ncbi:hypothetical protein C2S51_030437 [Perilla frutescens var. frutescens]|nr:hypothetical protein C2S51_030437 [Perilla frutescens var. frutescens]